MDGCINALAYLYRLACPYSLPMCIFLPVLYRTPCLPVSDCLSLSYPSPACLLGCIYVRIYRPSRQPTSTTSPTYRTYPLYPPLTYCTVPSHLPVSYLHTDPTVTQPSPAQPNPARDHQTSPLPYPFHPSTLPLPPADGPLSQHWWFDVLCWSQRTD